MVEGTYITTAEGYKAFCPPPLPVDLPSSKRLMILAESAALELGRLDSLCERQDMHILIEQALMNEAVLSSRIEGTQSTLADVFMAEANLLDHEERSKHREVLNHLRAFEYARHKLGELPICGRLVKETQRILLRGVRGGESRRTPGEYRRSQNYIGPPGCEPEEATYIPPPHDRLPALMKNWEEYVNEFDDDLFIVKCAVLHYQFEAIHPFMDGNGRIGRLLIPLFMEQEGILHYPVLYLSAFFEKNWQEYYDKLLRVSVEGDWEGWLIFFFKGVIEQSTIAAKTIRALLNLNKEIKSSIKDYRGAGTLLSLIDYMFEKPYFDVSLVHAQLNISKPAIQRAIDRLVEGKLVSEVTGKSWGRYYRFDKFFDSIRGGTE